MKTINVEKTASRGIVMGKAYLLDKPNLTIDRTLIELEDVAKEIKRYEEAVAKAEEELKELAESNAIFLAHLEMVRDITLYESVTTKILDNRWNAETALDEAINEFVEIFNSMEDEYMRERASDVKDIRSRILSRLMNKKDSAIEKISEEVILIAKDLTPSDTAALNLKYILGFITEEGGVTSHVSIMAKGLGLPALVGVNAVMNQVKQDDFLILDAGDRKIIINPDEDTLAEYKVKKEEYLKKEKALSEQNYLRAETKDGKKVTLCANVGNIQDIKNAIGFSIDGIGLFRSEFLYMENTHFPTEEEQFKIYKEAAELCPKELTIRTLDIGGDKELSYFPFEKEENPFLGWRAIRISLELTDIFKSQLRAILRASVFGKIRIMFPMIISLEELRQAKEILICCKEELKALGTAFDENIEIGMMIETPASVLCAEDFAKEVDFFSIGTNDLTQYMLAVDRGNKKIASMYNSFHPSVLRSIGKVIEAGHKYGVKVGMCGEFASNENAVKLLLGLGLDEFSMSAAEIPNVKYIVRNSAFEEVRELALKTLEASTIDEVYKHLGL